MPRKHHLRGQRFGSLVAREPAKGPGTSYWICDCDCGQTATVSTGSLVKGHTKSCGCLRRRMGAERQLKHGGSGTRAYSCWRNMISRCELESADDKGIYLGRGIRVCDRWRTSFPAFLDDMGEPPSPKHSIERIDNGGNYEPGNCRWATVKEQARNRRSTRHITHEGVTLSLAEWAEQSGLKYHTLVRRLKTGVPFGVAISLPVQSIRCRPMPREVDPARRG